MCCGGDSCWAVGVLGGVSCCGLVVGEVCVWMGVGGVVEVGLLGGVVCVEVVRLLSECLVISVWIQAWCCSGVMGGGWVSCLSSSSSSW